MESVYAPIEGTKRFCDIDGNVLTFEPCTEAQEGRIIVRIVRIHYGEDNEICVDYNFKQLYNMEGTSYREGTTTAFFSPDEDEDGKYRLNYIMEQNSRKVNAE